jgi:hypothetical protein
VQVSVSSSSPWSDLAPRIIAQLRASLRTREIGVCGPESDSSSSEAPIAKVMLEPASESKIAILVEVSDAITNKRVSRNLDLSNVPRDAWPLTLALAADEVLRASWAELALADAPPPSRPVPPTVRKAVRESMQPVPAAHARRAEIGAAFALETFSAGQLQIGIDARTEIWATRSFFVQALLGLRSARDSESDHGTIRSRALIFGGGAGMTLTNPDAPIGTDAIVRGKLSYVHFQGESDVGARDRSAWLTAFYAEAALAGWVAPAPSLRIALEVAAGVPIRSATARDDANVATGLDGGSFGLAFCFGGVF